MDGSHGPAQDSGRFHTRSEDFILVIGSFDTVDAAAHKVDEACRTFQFAIPISKGPCVPWDMLPRTSDLGSVTRQDHDGITQGGEVCRKRYPQESASARDND